MVVPAGQTRNSNQEGSEVIIVLLIYPVLFFICFVGQSFVHLSGKRRWSCVMILGGMHYLVEIEISERYPKFKGHVKDQ